MIRNFIFIGSVIILVTFQVSFFSAFDLARNYVNLALIAAVFSTTLLSFRRSFFFVVLAGLILDCYSPFGFGSMTLALIVPILIIYYLFHQLLAYKSIYSLLLVMTISTLMYHAVLFLSVNVFFHLNWSQMTIVLDLRYLEKVGWQLISHVLIIGLLFILWRAVRKKIKSRFLISEQV